MIDPASALPAAGAPPDAVVAALVALYDRAGAVHYGEDVTQREHAVQCAALLPDVSHDAGENDTFQA